MNPLKVTNRLHCLTGEDASVFIIHIIIEVVTEKLHNYPKSTGFSNPNVLVGQAPSAFASMASVSDP
jgi:hypothetical protein